MKSLPRAYEHFIETLNITTTNVDLKFDELCNTLLYKDMEEKLCSDSETKGSK
jgi:hypothetical protein